MAKFKKISTPLQWKEYYTKYPHGHTIFESLAEVASETNKMMDNLEEKTDRKGDHAGTWQGYQPTEVDPGIQAVVNTHDGKINDFEGRIEDIEDVVSDVVVNKETLTVTVGAAGDFPTINDALKYISNINQTYIPRGAEVTVLLLSGFIMEEQVLLVGKDLSYVSIDSEDPEVTIRRSTLTIKFRNVSYPAFGGERSFLPSIRCMFFMDESGDAENRDGFGLWECSSLNIKLTGGMRNAGRLGLYMSGASTFNGDRSTIKNSKSQNIYVSEVSTANIDKMDISGAGSIGITVTKGSRAYAGSGDALTSVNLTNCGTHAAIVELGSYLSMPFADVSGAGSMGVRCYGGYVDFSNGVAIGCHEGIVARGPSNVDARNATIKDSTNDGVIAREGATINLYKATIENSGGSGIFAEQGSSISAYDVTSINNGTTGAKIYDCSKADLNKGTFTGNGGYGVDALGSSSVNCPDSDITSNGSGGIYASRGSRINADNSDCRTTPGSDSNKDIRVLRGGIISARDAKGGIYSGNVENGINSAGIIFRS